MIALARSLGLDQGQSLQSLESLKDSEKKKLPQIK